MTAAECSELPKVFEDLWAEIRGSRIYAGQPRNTDSNRGVELATHALQLATEAQQQPLLLEAWRMLAYSLTANEQYAEALPYYESAITALSEQGNHALAARSRIGYVFALTHVGRYEDALRAASLAEKWFKDNHDDVGYARLCTNIASLHQRLDQYEQSYEHYASAARVFEAVGDKQALAQVHLNLGYTLARIDRFDETEAVYERAEEMANELGLDELWAQSSYNHAYFYFLLGRYSEALRAFARVRERFRESGSTRHYALCDLDEAEIYLQLNLSEDASTLAQSAIRQFGQIGIRYEEAKARAFHGVALMQMRRLTEALDIFKIAQEGFAAEGNQYWVAVLDLYRAEVFVELQRFWEAQALAAQAKSRFEALNISSRRMLSLVILGRISLALGKVDDADSHAREIAPIVEDTRFRSLRFPYYYLRGQIAERKKDWSDAQQAYSAAAEDLEQNQARLRSDDLRVAFLKGRNQIYEALVRLVLDQGTDALTEAYAWCERAKSRGLVELLANHLPSIHPRAERSLLQRVNRLREELNFRYVESRPEAHGDELNAGDVVLKEQELARMLREASVSDPESVSLQSTSTEELPEIQALLNERTTIVEYFCTDQEVIAFVISRDDARVFRRLAPPSRVQALHERLAFQVEKFLLGPAFIQEHSEQILQATNHYLRDMYDILIAPFAEEIKTPQITFIPHGPLHFLPFQAFWDGERYLTERFEIAYAPSASVLRYCMQKPDVAGASALIVGVADELAPMVEDEVRALGEAFPRARILTGSEATQETFTAEARSASFIHVATHATFRQDNPMFSSFKLSDGYVTALDLFSMTCETNLVTLSGCKSGVGKVTGSDDLLGLMRGFLYSGARSLMVSLWNVSDESTTLLMKEFYSAWSAGATRANALQTAMTKVRRMYPNPFYWAPFILVGKV
jgi:CHAT domain-containing protein/tetratricopeptide (TPR) repeat protein